jgi:LuxR family transcriptional regulator, quorum-sensing system regulator CinR
MNFDYSTALDGILQSSSVSDAILAIHQFDEINFITFHLLNNINTNMDNPFVRTNYPANWVSHYLLNNLVTSDPVLRHAMTAREAFCWSDLRVSAREVEFMKQAVSFGLGISGYSIPRTDDYGRRSVLSINSALPEVDWGTFIKAHGDELVRLAQDLHVKGVSEAYGAAGTVPNLSPREYECLKWTSLGKSHTDIAIILDLSEHTIRSYLKVARLKLDSVTLAQAVTKATNMGLI